MNQGYSNEAQIQHSIFERDEEFDNYEREQYQRGIRKARNALFIVGGLMFVADMVLLFLKRDQFQLVGIYLTVGIDILILSGFIGLGLYTKQKPYAAILTGLIFFCMIQAVVMVLDPSNIYKGIFVKIAVVATLISGLKKAKALRDLDRFAA